MIISVLIKSELLIYLFFVFAYLSIKHITQTSK